MVFRFGVVYLTLFSLATQISGSLIANLWFTYRGLGRLWPMRDVTHWVARSVFGVDVPLDDVSGGETLFFWIQWSWLLVASALIAGAWWLLDRRRSLRRVRLRPDESAWLPWGRLALRLLLAASMLEYGMTKVIPTQFPAPPLTALVTPVGDMTLSALLWTTIGSAPAYQIATGCVEVLAGVLLLLPRTVTLGAVLALLSLAQVLLLNLTFDIGVKLVTTHLIVMAVILLWPAIGSLASVLLASSDSRTSPVSGFRRKSPVVSGFKGTSPVVSGFSRTSQVRLKADTTTHVRLKADTTSHVRLKADTTEADTTGADTTSQVRLKADTTSEGARAVTVLPIAIGVYLLGVQTWINWSFWNAQGGGRPRSALYGIWDVERLSIDGQARPAEVNDYDRRWRRVIFDAPAEFVLQRTDDSFARFGASIDTGAGTIALTKGNSRTWSSTLTYDRSGDDEMRLRGEMDGHRLEAELRRVDASAFPLANSTFRWIRLFGEHKIQRYSWKFGFGSLPIRRAHRHGAGSDFQFSHACLAC